MRKLLVPLVVLLGVALATPRGASAQGTDEPTAGTAENPAAPTAQPPAPDPRVPPDQPDANNNPAAQGDPAQAGAPLPPFIQEINDRKWETGGNFWLPTPAAREARSDYMFYAVLALSGFFFTSILIVTIIFVVKYRARPGHKAQPSSAHNDVLEITWTVIPTIICVFLFLGGWNAYLDMNTRPAETITIKVTAQQWSWDFEYPNGLHLSDLHVPKDREVELQLTSTDVLHSLWVPNFRVKSDIVPRRYTYMYFMPTVNGTYRLYCTEYCGKGHSIMKNKAYVHDYSIWERYLSEAQAALENMDPVELGKKIYADKGCKTCHSVDGSKIVGPTWKGTWGKDVALADGKTVPMDAAYIKAAIEDPNSQIRSGYSAGMPSFAGQLSEAQINGVAAYIESLK